MNALVGVRANVSGLINPSLTQRKAAQQSIVSNERAYTLGKMVSPNVINKMTKADESNTTPSSDPVGDQLGRDAFLSLLLTQVANQDPLDPTDNAEMVAQLAQFSSLEQMNNMVDGLQTLTGNIDQLNFLNATGMLGRAIVGVDVDGNLVQGTVDNVQLDGSVVYLSVGDSIVSMAGVSAISDPK